MRSTRFLAALWAVSVHALSTAEWKSQSIYQVMTDRFGRTDNSTTASCNVNDYCGGSWQGIINHLDYIQGMGFTAIWISPVVENIDASTSDGEAYHGYWAQDIYALNSNFGDASTLQALSTALHDRGMYLMVDIVTNHMAYAGCGTCVDYSTFTPFDSSSYFHPYCAIDYSNSTSVVVCWEGDNIVALADLKTETTTVRTIFEDWVTDLVSNYSIDGLRCDSALEVEKAFWPLFEDASGVFNIGEVDNGDPTIYPDWLNYLGGVLNYADYYWILRAFDSTTYGMSELVSGINEMKGQMTTSTLGMFLENHDVPRFASYTSDMDLAKNGIAFTMLMDGIPIIYQGQEQHFSGGSVPDNREALWTSEYDTSAELYTWITSLNKIRNYAASVDSSSYLDYQAWPFYSDSQTIAMRKYNVISVFTNIGASGSSYSVTLDYSYTGWSASESLVEVMGCTSYTTDSNGNLTFTMGTTAAVFYPLSKLSGSGICTSLTGGSTTTTSTTSTTKTTSSTTSTTLKTTTTTTSSQTTTTTSKTTSSTSSSTSSCATATAVAVTFDEIVTTSYGETIKIAGDVSALGDWDTDDAIALSAANYTSSDPLWFVTISLTPGEVIEYKYINVASGGSVTWEADPNHTYTVPSGCTTAATVENEWQS